MIYQDYAPFYDASGQIRFAVLIGQYLREMLARHPVAGRQALDLACGTGTLALILADEGWDVLGIDASAAMLALARAKAEQMETEGVVEFVQGDLRDVPIDPQERGTFDLATCTYDSMNYLLTEADLLACFSGVAQALTPGGLFFFDLNTRRFLEQDWLPCEVEERRDYVQLQQSTFDPLLAQSDMRLTVFVGNDQDGYQRIDELHIERAYPPEMIAALLEQAGLAVEGCYTCFTFQPLNERTQREAWVARKPVD